MGNTEYFFINKEFKELLEYFEDKYSQSVLGVDYGRAIRYISIIKTAIENIDAIYSDVDQLDKDVHEALETYCNILKDYMDFKVNMLLPSNATADGLLLFSEMKKIKGYLLKMILIFKGSDNKMSIGLSDILNQYDSYIKVRNDSYDNLRKELEEYEKQQSAQEEQSPEENIIPSNESMISENKDKNETL